MSDCRVARSHGNVILEKLKAMGFAQQPLDEPIATHCQNCGYAFNQQTFAFYCPACKNCTVHCYAPEMRQRIRQVMKFSGIYFIKCGRLDWVWRYFG